MRIKDFGKISNEISDVLPAYLPAVVVFILIPFALYLPNQSVLDYNLIFIIPYLVLAVLYFIFLISLLFFVGQPLRTRIVILLFYIGVYVCLSDIMSPVQLVELFSGQEQVKEPLFLTAVEVVLAIVVIFFAIKLPWKHVKRFGSMVVLLLLVSEVILVFNGLRPETNLHYGNDRGQEIPNPKKLAASGNIYHITFDGYSSVIFLEALEEMKLTEEFDGFTFFQENRSNYALTRVSVPSYMTGSFYEEDDSLKEWQDQIRSSGIVKNVYDAGYEVSVYAPGEWWIHEKASRVKTYEDILMRYQSLSSSYQFADLWLLRVVPNFLQQEIYWEGKGIFTRLFIEEDKLAGNNAKIFSSVQLMRQLIDDETERPDHGQYVYAHIHVPHIPYIMNRDCVFSPDGDYNEQALCATRLMIEFISKLKELGRYHDSIIIFQSDHGWFVEAPDYAMSSEVEKKMDAVNLRRITAKTVDNLTHALLLIKPSLRTGEPLVISDRPTQLVDIPATIYDLSGLPVHTKKGRSVFSPEFPETREIHIFIGFRQKNEKGEPVDPTEGPVNHFSFTDGNGWKVYPNMPVQWE